MARQCLTLENGCTSRRRCLSGNVDLHCSMASAFSSSRPAQDQEGEGVAQHPDIVEFYR
jgi:hypothetical protein